jgi:hypothetical protein
MDISKEIENVFGKYVFALLFEISVSLVTDET